MIEPFYFDNNRLYGTFTAAADSSSRKLVVICPPLFDEYRRTYRALYELAIGCSAQGLHVLRFDYYGTGESWGLLEEATIQGWVTDINSAIEEGVALSGADRVILTGVRFGATLASQSTNKYISKFIFWDPIPSGQQYLDWLTEIDKSLENQHKQNALNNNLPFEQIKYENFHLPDIFKDDLAKLKIPEQIRKDSRTTVITTDKTIEASGIYNNCEFTGLEYAWPTYHDGVITQKPVLEAIATKAIQA